MRRARAVKDTLGGISENQAWCLNKWMAVLEIILIDSSASSPLTGQEFGFQAHSKVKDGVTASYLEWS